MYRLSCFADEISPELHEQIAFMKENGLGYMELRSVWEKNVLDLDDGQLAFIKEELDKNNMKVSSIGSPIGKVSIEENFDTYLKKFHRAIDIALKMNTEYIRIFSFYMKREEKENYKNEVIRRIKIMVDIASRCEITLLHENEADIFGESSDRCAELLEAVNNRNFKAVMDPSNFVAAGEDVFVESLKKVKKYIHYMHIKDSIRNTGEIVIAGQGDACIKQILEKLRDRDGMFVSLEPHLAFAGKYKGFTGPELFHKDLDALKKILSELNIEYV